ncbi:5413_t:CDS:2 [Scutellospora calospora]|uniref:5413_t:CDS:1 n=1 Tax=Scutellospora calospora TaxID=85575 RepID=A0ACA9K2F9_9GLOM|nr:5413_t:CDS:2 [Scutellospora calospora]
MGTIFDSMEVIENERINCIDCSEFTDPENIADGVYKLEWKNYGMPVARKCIKAKVNPKEVSFVVFRTDSYSKSKNHLQNADRDEGSVLKALTFIRLHSHPRQMGIVCVFHKALFI